MNCSRVLITACSRRYCGIKKNYRIGCDITRHGSIAVLVQQAELCFRPACTDFPDRYSDVSFTPNADEDERQHAIRRTPSSPSIGAKRKSRHYVEFNRPWLSISFSSWRGFFFIFFLRFPFHSLSLLRFCFLTISLSFFLPPLGYVLFFPGLWYWNTISFPDNELTKLFQPFCMTDFFRCEGGPFFCFFFNYHLLVLRSLLLCLHSRSAW